MLNLWFFENRALVAMPALCSCQSGFGEWWRCG